MDERTESLAERCTCLRHSERRGKYLYFWYTEDPKCPVRGIHGALPLPHKVRV